MAFYEPLNEALATSTLRDIAAMRPGATDSRHPDPERPYFEEFAPLIPAQGRGVTGYPVGASYDQFLAGPQTNLPGLASYLDSLVRFAHANGKIAVMKHCRTVGRLGWMRTHFPSARHIAVVRSPWGQWLSGWRIYKASGNAYFVTKPLEILALHHDQPLFARALKALHLSPELLNGAVKSATRRGLRLGVSAATAPGVFYRAFLAFWTSMTYTTLLNVEDVIDSDRLGGSQAYRRETEQMIQQRSGLTIDLSNAHPLPAFGPVAGISSADIERWHSEAVSSLSSFAELDRMIPQARQYATSAIIGAKLAGDVADLPIERNAVVVRGPRSKPQRVRHKESINYASIRFWFCIAAAVIAVAIADPLVEGISNAGWFGRASYTDHSNLDVLPTLALGALLVVLYLVLRVRRDLLQASDDALHTQVSRLLAPIFGLQLALLASMETLEQIIVDGHSLGRTIWLGGPIWFSLSVHAAVCVAVSFGLAKLLRAWTCTTVRIIQHMRA
jgi:hypothetical protein